MANLENYRAPEGMRPGNGDSHAVAARGGRVISVAGQVAMDERRELVGRDDPRAQAEQVENLRLALAAADASFADVIKVSVFTTDILILPIVREVRDRYVVTGNPPATTAVQVQALFRPGYQLEIEALALVD